MYDPIIKCYNTGNEFYHSDLPQLASHQNGIICSLAQWIATQTAINTTEMLSQREKGKFKFKDVTVRILSMLRY